MRITLALTLLLAIVSGCAISTSPAPAPDAQMATVSTRFEYHPMGGTRWQRHHVTHVDGVRVSQNFLEEGNADLKIAPGDKTLSVVVTFLGWPTVPDVHGIQQANVEMPIRIERGRVYRVRGEPRGNRYFLWLEEVASGKRVGEETSAPYGFQRREYIFTPVRPR
jgi:hypothetical protein